jgi:hypothetical protein
MWWMTAVFALISMAACGTLLAGWLTVLAIDRAVKTFYTMNKFREFIEWDMTQRKKNKVR